MRLSDIWHAIQVHLFPAAEQEYGPLTATHKRVLETLVLLKMERFILADQWRGRGVFGDSIWGKYGVSRD